MADLARIIVYGDIHLSSKNYGAHVDYPVESLNYFRNITAIAKEKQATHIIGLGDFSYGRFNTLEYRGDVEEELETQYRLVNGNRYEIRGNHDTASYGMTEYERYIKKGLLKQSDNLTIGNTHITMIDYNKTYDSVMNIGKINESINIVLAHDYYKFRETQLPDMGKAIELDNLTHWFGVDYLICGHIHNQYAFEGLIVKEENNQSYGHKMMVQYPGSLPRPSYREGHMDLTGQIVMLVIRDNGELEYNSMDVELLPLEKSFNLSKKAIEKELKTEKQKQINISDIISQLDSHERNIGNPEDIIMALKDVDDKYKNKAIQLLKAGQA